MFPPLPLYAVIASGVCAQRSLPTGHCSHKAVRSLGCPRDHGHCCITGASLRHGSRVEEKQGVVTLLTVTTEHLPYGTGRVITVVTRAHCWSPRSTSRRTVTHRNILQRNTRTDYKRFEYDTAWLNVNQSSSHQHLFKVTEEAVLLCLNKAVNTWAAFGSRWC